MKTSILNIIITFIIFIFSFSNLYSQGSITSTYFIADIPTGYNGGNWDPACNGSNTTLTIQLPTGIEYEVLGIDIEYDVVAAGNFWMSGANSQIYFQNLGVSEPAIYEGTGNTAGTEHYSRTNVNIANGIYAGETELIFEMRAWRDYQTQVSGCTTQTGKIQNGTWKITLYHSEEIIPPRVGINNSTPKATLDVGGDIIISNSSNLETAGMIKFENSEFKGFDGSDWKKLTTPQSVLDDITTLNDEVVLLQNEISQINTAEKIYSITYGFHEFKPSNLTAEFVNTLSGKWVTSGAVLYKQIELPAGAKIISMSLGYYDNDPTYFGSLSLTYQNVFVSSNAVQIANINTFSEVERNFVRVLSTDVNHTTLNNNSYILRFENGNSTEVRIKGAKIVYSLPIID